MITKHLIYRLSVIVGCFFAAGSVVAKQEVFDDWALNCQQSCYIFQGMQSKNNNTLYAIQISKPDKDNVVIELKFPLGLYIPTGIGIAVGNFKKNIPLTTCLPNGCSAILIMNDEIEQQFKLSNQLNVRFFTAQNQENEITFSLKGFKKAFDSMI